MHFCQKVANDLRSVKLVYKWEGIELLLLLRTRSLLIYVFSNVFYKNSLLGKVMFH